LMAQEYPPQSVKILLVLTAIVWLGTMVWALLFLNKVDAQSTSQPSTQAPAENAPPSQ
jgi:hypothetical protein